MNDSEISQFIIDNFDGVDVLADSGTSFFFYNPPGLPPDHMFPFVTMVTNDLNDPYSDLDRRPSAFRLNIGVSKQTFRALFGEPKLPTDKRGAPIIGAESDYDFTVLDQLMPHPVYGGMYWVCVLNPSDETFETKARPLLDEAYKMAVKKRKK